MEMPVVPQRQNLVIIYQICSLKYCEIVLTVSVAINDNSNADIQLFHNFNCIYHLVISYVFLQ